MHNAEQGDVYLDDGLHNRLATGTGVLVTEPMHCDGGRGGHAYHGEWWWRDRVPADVEIDVFYSDRWLAEFRAARALPEIARALGKVLRLDVVALGALVIVVVHLGARLRRMERGYLRHLSPPFGLERQGAYIGTRKGGVA
jgi:hypothetical protein